MPHNSVKICTAVLVFTAMTVGQVQAQAKGKGNLGASTFAPGHQAPVAGDLGKSGNAPGDLKHDNPGASAKSFAPGTMNPNKKK
jgi:hypothetical protein